MAENSIMEVDGIDLGLPQKNIPDVWLMSLIRSLERMELLIRECEDPSDWRLRAMTDQIIMKITEDQVRTDLALRLDENIKKINEDRDMDNSDKAVMTLRACQLAIGELVSWADYSMALTKTMKVLPI